MNFLKHQIPKQPMKHKAKWLLVREKPLLVALIHRHNDITNNYKFKSIC
jgi:hypothetical protein